MDYLVNIILSNIQYFLWSSIVALIYAILSGRVEVILKITSKEIRLYIKKKFLHLIHSYVNTEFKKNSEIFTRINIRGGQPRLFFNTQNDSYPQ